MKLVHLMYRELEKKVHTPEWRKKNENPRLSCLALPVDQSCPKGGSSQDATARVVYVTSGSSGVFLLGKANYRKECHLL